MSENTQNNNIGSAILAAAAAIGRTYGRKPDGKKVRASILLEKQGVVRPVAERVETGEFFSEEALTNFKALAASGDEGAQKVVDIDNELKARSAAISAFKAGTTDEVAVPEAE